MRGLKWELTGAGLENFGRGGQPSLYEVEPPGPGELLARVDACGICFSDIKILDRGEAHPRLRGRDLASTPVVMGHEVSLTILAVGPGETAPGGRPADFQPGDRAIVQADVYYQGQGMAMGYRLPGGFSQYVRLGREVLEGDEGCYLLPVPPHLGHSEAALCEPWACVEASYRYVPRRSLRRDGRLLVVAADVDTGALIWPDGDERPGSVVVLGNEETLSGLPRFPAGWPAPSVVTDGEADAVLSKAQEGAAFDDIIVLGELPAERNEALLPLLRRGGILNLVGAAPSKRVAVDVGRVHYEDIGIVGTSGPDIGRGYTANRGAELTPGGVAWFIGAGGPMGQMHLQRALSLPHPPRKIVATQNTGPRLVDLRERFAALARERGIAFTLLNPKELSEDALYARLREECEGAGFDDIICLVPNVPTIERAGALLARGGGVNLFAGVPVGTPASLNLRPIVERGVRYWGTSGSSIADLRHTADKLAAGDLATDAVVAAVAGIRGVRDGLAAVREGRFLGKTMIYPQLEALPLMSIVEVASRFPSVAERLTRGRYWNREAEAELIRLVAES